jgi:uncharacterized protein
LGTQTLNLDVRDLLRAETGESAEFSAKLDPKEIPDADLKVGTLEARLTKLPEGILARFRGDAALRLTCDRCLEEFDFPVSLEASEEFALKPGEEQWPISREGHVDLAEPLRQTLVLAQPTQPLCRPDCPGLCTICGESLKDSHVHT